MAHKITLFILLLCLMASCKKPLNNLILTSPDEKIEVILNNKNGNVSYAVFLNKQIIISQSALGLKSDTVDQLEIIEVKKAYVDHTWESVWGIQKVNHDNYNEIQLKIGGLSTQTIVLRVYNDGIAFRYRLPGNRKINEETYRYEVSEVSFVSEQPTAWFPLSHTLVSDAVDVNSWQAAKVDHKKVNKNKRYDFKPSVIATPFTVKLSERAYISVHEAAVIHSDDSGLNLEGNTLTYRSNNTTAGGFLTPWRTITITDCPGGLIESSLIVNLNEPCELNDKEWIKPGKTMWDWRNHGALADDGFKYDLTTESYIRYINFASENSVEYVLVDAEWYGPERDRKSDPKTYLPQIDIPQICEYAKSKGVGMWLYVNTIGLEVFDIDETLKQFNEWGVVGIKMGFLNGSSRNHIERAQNIAKKCAEYKMMYTLHEPHKPTGYRRTYPNILAYEYVNSMLDGPSRPSATPSRVINQLFVHGLTGPVDRSCGMFDLDDFISRDKCHRQIPSTVVSQAAQCLLFPSGLLTLPDHPDAYKRKIDLFEFIGKLPMNWDETLVLDAEIGKYITMARRSDDQWFVASLADENGRTTNVNLNFLEDGKVYDITLYEDGANAHYEFFGPENKNIAKATNQEMKPHKTNRELYIVRKKTVKKGDIIKTAMAPGGGHCMWIRPCK
jgi:alpha-glucosidase